MSLFDENGMKKTAKSKFYDNFKKISLIPFGADAKKKFRDRWWIYAE